MTLRDVLAAGTFSVTAEVNPPANPVADPVRQTAVKLAPHVAAANVTDNAAAAVKVSPVAAATWMLQEGLEPIMQITTRDRNILALQSELLSAWALGVRNILALGGDPLKVGKYAEIATRVGDLDSLGLIRLIRRMNEGELAAGEKLSVPTGFYVASAMNPLVDSPEKVKGKLQAGTEFFQTNIVYDVPRFAKWFAPLVGQGLLENIPVLVGVMPPRSTRALEHMHNNIPGVEVDDATFDRLRGLTGDAAKDAGVQVAADVVGQLREVSGVAGVHIMAPTWESEAVARVVEAAGLEAST
jgi:5,10-methylenetetrahydrofolate reductase